MTDLIACLSSGKGTWSQVQKVIASENWERVFLITNDFGKENFQSDATYILINPYDEVTEIKRNLVSQLREQKLSFEVALNLTSGAGKEHMALISALFELGKGIRLVDISRESLVLL